MSEQLHPIVAQFLEEAANKARAKSKPATTASKPVHYSALRKATEVKPVKRHWFWPNVFPANTPSILNGDEETLKTTLTIGLISRVSNGQPFPDGAPCRKGKVLIICNAEDKIDEDWIPRLKAAKANLRQNRFLQSQPQKVMWHHLEQGGFRLVLIDPLKVLLNFSDWKMVRTQVEELMRLADEQSFTVIGVVHNNKEGKMSGPNDLRQVVRTIVTTQLWDGDNYIMTREKSNHSESGTGLKYHREMRKVKVEDSDGRMFLQPTPIVVFDNHWSPMDKDKKMGGGRQLSRAITFLKAELADGAQTVQHIKRESTKNEVISWRTIETAKARLGIKTKLHEDDGQYYWHL